MEILRAVMKPLALRWLLIPGLFALLPSAQAQQPLPSAKNTPVAAATKDTPFVNSLGMKFVPVAGTKVLFSVWETRVQDFAAFSKEMKREAEKEIETPGFPQGPTHPAVMMTWVDAVAFCARLSKKEGRQYRLPTDIEWSAAMGFGEETDNPHTPERKDEQDAARKVRIYPWGKVWPPPRGIGNYADGKHEKANPGATFIAGYDDGFAHTSPAGSFVANAFGLCDLSGNVAEWCEDLSIEKSGKRVLRGGSWKYGDAFFLRSASRLYYSTESRSDDFGFRCVLAVPGG